MMFAKSGEPVLFVAQLDGTIKRYVIEKQSDGTFEVSNAKTPSQIGDPNDPNDATINITTIKDTVENYNDVGNVDDGNQNDQRQITGLVTTVEVVDGIERDVIYVSSSVRRHGGGNNATDQGIDANSGQINKLIIDQFSGEVIDSYAVIRGLPRSSENHSTNGIDLALDDDDNVIMYIAQGGNTNKGAPSNNFVGFIDNSLSGTILKVDLTELESYDVRIGANSEKFILDIPTVNDPGRPDVDLSTLNIENLEADPLFSLDVAPGDAPEWAGSSDAGNATNSAKITSHVLVSENGQLKLVANPISVFQPGYRNQYDVHVTEAGEVVSWDNGPNSGWGGQPVPLEDTTPGNNTNYVTDWTAELATNDFNESGSNTFGDWLHVGGKVSDEFGPYAGDANPIRAAVEALALAFKQDQPLYVEENDTLVINTAVYAHADLTAPILDLDGQTVLFTDFEQALNFLSRLTPHYDEQSDGSWVDVRPEGPASPQGAPLKLMPTDLHTIVAGYDWEHPGSSLSNPENHFNGTPIGEGTAFSPEAQLLPPGQDGGLIQGGTSTNGLSQYTASSWFGGALDGALISTAFGGAKLQFVELLDTNSDGRTDAANEIGTISSFGSQPLSVQALGDDGLGGALIDNDGDGVDDFSGVIFAATYGADNITTFVPGGTPTDPTVDADGDGIDDTNDTHAWGADNGKGVLIGSFFGPLEARWDMELSSGATPPGAATNVGPAPDAGIVAAWKNGEDAARSSAGGSRDGFLYDGENFDLGGASSFLSVGTAPVGSAEGAANSQKDALAVGAILSPSLAGATITAEMLNIFDYQVNAERGTDGAGWDGGEKVGIFVGPDQSTFMHAAVVVQADGTAKLELYAETNDGNPQVQTVDLTGIEAPFGIDDPQQDSVIQIGFGIDLEANTAVARARYQNPNLDGDPSTADADWSDWFETDAVAIPQAVLDSLYGDHVNFGNEVGATVGMFANAPAGDDSFAASWDWVEIVGTPKEVVEGEVLYRWNAGTGANIAAIDGGPDWVTSTTPIIQGSTNKVSTHNITQLDSSVPADTTPVGIFAQERWEENGGSEWTIEFGSNVLDAPLPDGEYAVRLFMGNGYGGTSQPGQRVFDISIEGELVQDDFGPVAAWGHQVGGMVEWIGTVNDGAVTIEFQREVENPQINGIEILALGDGGGDPAPVVSIAGGSFAESAGPNAGVTITTNTPVPENETVIVTWEVRAVPGGATPEVDFTVPGGSFVSHTGDGVYQGQSEIAGSSSDVTIPITITNDTVVEGAELFEVAITGVSGAAATIGTGTATVTIVDDDVASGTAIYRVNAGGAEVAATDGGIAWSADQSAANANGTAQTGTPSPYLDLSGANAVDKTFGASFTGTNTTGVPNVLFETERFSDAANPDNMSWDFAVADGDYLVRLFFVETWTGAQDAGVRVFDVNVEGSIPAAFDDIDPAGDFGFQTPGVAEATVNVDDGNLDIDFIKNNQNPALKAIEIVSVGGTSTASVVSIAAPTPASVQEGDGGVTTLIFPVSFDVAPSAEVAIAYEVDINGAVTTGSLNLGQADGQISVDVANDDVANGTETVTVTITGVSSGPATIGTAAAIGTVTEDDQPDVQPGAVLFRVNVGGPELAATDGGPAWGQDQGNFGTANNSPYLTANSTGGSTYNGNAGSAHSGPIDVSDASIPAGTPAAIFNTERYDLGSAPEQQWQFPVADQGLQPGDQVEVRLYFAELFGDVDMAGERVFDVQVEGSVPTAFDDIDPIAAAGAKGGFIRSATVTIDADGTLDLTLVHGIENPALKGIEILAVGDPVPVDVTLSIANAGEVTENGSDPTALDFALTATDGFSGEMTVAFDVDVNGTPASDSQVVTFTNGAGVLALTVPSDDDPNGPETVAVTLTGATDNEASDPRTVVLGTAEASGTVVEDDVAVVDSFNGTAAPGDDWSNDNAQPDAVTLIEGPNTLVSTGEGGDSDFITFMVAEGQQVTAITLAGYVGGDNFAFLGIQQGESVPLQSAIEAGSATLDGGTVYGATAGPDLLPLLASTSVENAPDSPATAGLATPLQAGTYTLWFNQNGGLTETTLEIVSEAVPGPAPDDIDGDGILNIDDPFAYDGTNGDARVLTPGAEFTQDFDTDTDDPFSAEGGFSGILVNPAFAYPGTSEADPYGARTNEDKVSIANGTLSVTSSNFDAFPTSGTGNNNTLADGYQSAVDVSGATKFEVHARVNSADWLGKTTTTTGYEQFGITLGAGGVDDFVKLVISDNNNNGANPQRVQIAHNGSIDTAGGNATEDNYNVGAASGPNVDLALVGDYELRLIVDRAAGANGQIVGQVDFFAAADGSLLESFVLPAVDILPGSSLEAALDGQNPLTGGDGGLAYGIFVSDWSGSNNQITANYDFLTVRSLDAPADVAPIVELQDVIGLVENADTSIPTKVANIVVTDEDPGTVTLSLSDETNFEILGTELFLKANVALDHEDTPSLTVDVFATDLAGNVSAPAEANIAVGDVDEAPTLSGTQADVSVVAGDSLDLSAITASDEDVNDSATVAVTVDGSDVATVDGFAFANGALSVSQTVVAGDYAIVVSAVDADGTPSETSVAFTLTVAPFVSAAPTLENAIADQTADEDAAFTFTVPAGTFADDGGADNLTLSAALSDNSPLPDWLTFDPLTATFSGTPLQADVDAGPLEVKVTAADADGQSVTDTFTLTPANVNDAPTISGTIVPLTTTAGVSTTADLSTLLREDEDGGTPSLTVTVNDTDIALTDGFTLNGTTLEVDGTVAEGTYAVAVFADDGELLSESAVTFDVTVSPPLNEAPTAVTVTPVAAVLDGIADDTDTTDRIKLADIAVIDDGLGTNDIEVTGADEALVEVDGLELFLKAGTTLDFQSNPSIDVTVSVSDAGVAGSSAVSADLTIAVDEAVVVDDEDEVTVTQSTASIDLGAPGKATKVTAGADIIGTVPIKNFGQEDEIVVTGVTPAQDVTPTIVSITQGSTKLGIDTNGNLTDAELMLLLEGGAFEDASNFEASDFELGFNGASGQLSVKLAPVPQPQPLTLEFEDVPENSAFYVENQGAASGGQVLRLASNATGTFEIDLAAQGLVAGTYDIALDIFDESDGVSTLTVTVGGQTFDFVLDQDGGGNAAQAQNLRTLLLPAVTIGADGTATISAQAGGGEFVRLDKLAFTPTVPAIGNQQPFVFDGVPTEISVDEGTSLVIDLSDWFSDPDEDALTFSIDGGAPAYATLANGVLTIEPAVGDVTATPADVIVTASDGTLSASHTFALGVSEVNQEPQLSGTVLPAQTFETGEEIDAIDASALFTDPDVGDLLTYTATGLPAGLTLDETTGVIAGTPTVPGSFTVAVTATDLDGASVSANIFIDAVGAPVADPITVQAEDFTTLGNFVVETQGAAEGNQVIRLKSNQTGEASLAVAEVDGLGAGSFDVTVMVFDESDGDTATIGLEVDGVLVGEAILDQSGGGNAAQPQNRRILDFGAVELTETSVVTIVGTSSASEFARADFITFTPTAGGAVNFRPTLIPSFDETQAFTSASFSVDLLEAFSDDKETLTFSLGEGAPDFLSIVDNNLVASGAVTGDVTVTLIATDSDGLSNQRPLTLDIDVPTAPSLDQGVPDQLATEDAPFSLTVPSDAFSATDGDPITYTFAGANGAALPASLTDDGNGTLSGTLTQADVDASPLTIELTATDKDGSTVTSFTITAQNVNDAPTAVGTVDDATFNVADGATIALPANLFEDEDGETLTLSAALDDGQGGTAPLPDWLVFDATAGTFTVAPDAAAADLYTVVVTASDAANAFAQVAFDLTVTAIATDPLAPDGDLDGDSIVNSADPDVDEDNLNNADEGFAYDAANGALLAAGDAIELTFETDGTPYQGGWTGLLQSGNASFTDEETGSATVTGGQFVVPNVTNGDTGGSDNPQDDYQVGVKNGTFTVEASIDNPWFGAAAGNSYDQIGVHVGLNSFDFVKLVLKHNGPVEFALELGNSQTKVGGGDQALPNGLSFDDAASFDIRLEVASVSATEATVSGFVTFRDAVGNVLPGGDDVSFGTGTVDGLLAAALADETQGVGVGFTHANAGSAQTSFDAKLNSFKVSAPPPIVDSEAPTVGAIAIAPIAVGDATATVSVVVTDDVGVDAASVAVDDLVITSPDGADLPTVTEATFADGVATYTLTAPTGGFVAGAYSVATAAEAYADAANNLSVASAAQPFIVADDTGGGEPEVLLRINAGGPEVAVDGELPWTQDLPINLSGGTGSGDASTSSPYLQPITPLAQNRGDAFGYQGTTVPDGIVEAVLGSARSSDNPFTYSIPVADLGNVTNVTVRLYMAELFTGNAADDDRVFDVTVEGQTPAIFDDIDLADDGDAFGAEVREFDVSIVGDTLDITFAQNSPAIENPVINAIEILSQGGNVVPTLPVVSIANAVPQLEGGNTGTTTLTFPITFSTTPSAAVVVEYTTSLDGATQMAVIEPAGGTIEVAVENDDLADGPDTVTVTLTGATGANLGGTTATGTVAEDDDGVVGAATLAINENADNIQVSNFGSNSFQVTNVGDKAITKLEIDVTDALYPDAVFDPFGNAGDMSSKALVYTSGSGATGAIAPNNNENDPNNETYVGLGGINGYEGIVIEFTDFGNGETLGFAVDMDPNSVAGSEKNTLDGGANPNWDVGGISGAELIGSTFTVTFDDGTTATGQLQGVGNNGGSKGLASQASPELAVSLTVNGIGAGGEGVYGEGGPQVIINGPANETARIVLTKGIIQPTENDFTGAYGAQLAAQLAALEASGFPANNAAFFQTVDVTLTGGNQDISSLFNFSDVPDFNLEGAGHGPEDELPLGFAAAVIDPGNDDLPKGPVISPIHVVFDEGGVIPGTTLSVSADALTVEEAGGVGTITPVAFTVSASGPLSGDVVVSYDLTIGDETTNETATLNFDGANPPKIIVEVDNDDEFNGPETVSIQLTGTNAADVNVSSSVAASAVTEDEAAPPEPGAFIEQDGLVVIEMESANNLPGDWETVDSYSTDDSPNVNNPNGATGGDFIVWQGGQFLGSPGTGVIEYQVIINDPGAYQFSWRNQVGNGTNTTEHNDTWLKIEADQFYGLKGGTTPGSASSIVKPKGAADGTFPDGASNPEGAGSNGWFKIYSSGANNWSWSTNTSDNDAHQIFAHFDQAGTYSILVSARSSSHAIDRMVLSKVGIPLSQAQNLGNPESARVINATDTTPTVVAPIDDLNVVIGTSTTVDAAAAFNDLDGDDLDFILTGAPAGVTINEETGLITIGDGVALGTYTLTVTASDDDDNEVADAFDLTVSEQPVLPAELRFAVQSGGDDVEEFGGAGSGDLEFGFNAGQNQFVGIRFDGVTIADASQISGAYIEFEAEGSNSNIANLQIEIENDESAAPLTAGNIPGRSYLSPVAWSGVEAWTGGQTYRTPDLAAVLKQVIGDSVNDGALAFQITATSGSGTRSAYSFNNAGGPAPVLVIETSGDPVDPVNQPPSISLNAVVSSVAEGLSTRTKVADIVVSDDALGSNSLSLTDDSSFEIDGDELFLKAGLTLAAGELSVTVQVDDPSVGSTPDDTAQFALTVDDVVDPPLDGPLTFAVLDGGKDQIDALFEDGDSYDLDGLGSSMEFTGLSSDAAVASVVFQIAEASGNVVDEGTENSSPWDITFELGGVAAGDYTLTATSYAGPDGTGTVLGVQSLDFSLTGEDAGAVNFFGGPGDDVLTGNSKNNMIRGEAGNDTLSGGAGNDTLNAGSGVDILSGGTGDDVYIVSMNATVNENPGEGTDRVQSWFHRTIDANVEELELLGSNNLIGRGGLDDDLLIGNGGRNVLSGDAGNDEIFGGAGDDTVFAGAGADSVEGGSGNDSLEGGDGNDTLLGNAGNDTLKGNGGADAMLGGEGDDYYVTGAGDVITEAAGEGNDVMLSWVSTQIAANVETLQFAGTANLNGSGSSAGETLIGNAGNNRLIGNGGGDTLEGLDGNDYLSGGAGTDVMTGGSGNDVFHFNAAPSAVDTVTDFDVAADQFELASSAFAALSAGTLGASEFTTGSAATTADHHVIYDSATGDLFYDADGTGSTAQVQFASLSSGLALTNSDFDIV